MEILSKHDYLHGPCERGDLIRTVQALAEALAGESPPRECANPECEQCARLSPLREKGWLE